MKFSQHRGQAQRAESGKGQGRGKGGRASGSTPASGASSALRSFTSAVWEFLLAPQVVPGTFNGVGTTNMEASLTARIDEFVSRITAVAGFSPGAGTISVTNGSSVITGSGTAFTSHAGGRTYKWTDNTGTPRYYYLVSASNNTTGVIGAPEDGFDSGVAKNYAGPTQSGISYSVSNTTTDANGVPVDEFNSTYNYYDTVFALYQAWSKVDDQAGGSTILTKARQIADALADTRTFGGFRLPSNYGFNTSPRTAGLIGFICRAVDGGATFNHYFDAIDAYLDGFHRNIWLERYETGALLENSMIASVRDGAYVLMFMAILAVCHYDSSRRTYWRDKAVELAVDPCIRRQTIDLGGGRWKIAFSGPGEWVSESDGTTPAPVAQPFIDSLMIEALIWVHRMMRYHALTGDPDYTTIGDAIVAGCTGWYTSYEQASNGRDSNLRAVPFFSGLAGQKYQGTTALTVLTPPGSPYAIKPSGTSYFTILDSRQQNADGVAQHAYAYAINGLSAHNAAYLEALNSCFRDQANGSSLYSSLWYSGQTQKNWNQHHRMQQKGPGWLEHGLETLG